MKRERDRPKDEVGRASNRLLCLVEPAMRYAAKSSAFDYGHNAHRPRSHLAARHIWDKQDFIAIFLLDDRAHEQDDTERIQLGQRMPVVVVTSL